MARDRQSSDEYVRPIRRVLIGMLVLVLAGLFLLWRIDSPRVERFRAELVDRVVPSFDWVMSPFTRVADMVDTGWRDWLRDACADR